MILRFILEEVIPWYGKPKFITILLLSILFFIGSIVSLVFSIITDSGYLWFSFIGCMYMAVAMFYGIGDLYDAECSEYGLE